MKKVLILGGGISGLSLAWYLNKFSPSPLDIHLFEASERVGGWIQSEQKGHTLFEKGPRGCRPSGAGLCTLELVEDLGLDDEVVASSEEATIRYLYWDGCLQSLPTGLWSLLFSPLTRGLPSALLREPFVKMGTREDESIYSFVERRFGRIWAEKLADPMSLGIFGGDARRLSLRSCFPKLFQMEKENGSLLKGMFKLKKASNGPSQRLAKRLRGHALFSFQEGMETLPKALYSKFPGTIHCNASALHLEQLKQGIRLEYEGGSLEGDVVFSTLPAPKLAQVLGRDLPSTRILMAEERASMAVLGLTYPKGILKQKGFGYLVPSSQGQDILGSVWDSEIFPDQLGSDKFTRLTVMLGGPNWKNIAHQDDREKVQRGLLAVQRHLDIAQPPLDWDLHIARHAIPQYPVGYHQRLQKLEESLKITHPNLLLMGTSFRGVAVNECISQARSLAKDFV